MMHALDIVMLNQSIAFHTIYVIIRIYWTVLLCYKCKSMLMAKCEYNLYTCIINKVNAYMICENYLC